MLSHKNLQQGRRISYAHAPTAVSIAKLKPKATLHVKGKGNIVIQFFIQDAPLTVTNFQFLSQEKFYDGLLFHRREEAFVIQGGDPSGDGTGGPGYQFPDEPVRRAYTRGIVAMANAGPNTNGSQFFIMLENVPLPPVYTIFGHVTEGIEVVDAVHVGDIIESIRLHD